MHKIPSAHIDKLTRGPSATKTAQVANLQNFIQDLLSDTHHAFLQGSYANDTAIADINDVDIIAIRKTTYSGTYSPHRFEQSVFWDQIFTEIKQKLENQNRYTWTVTKGDKCIKVKGEFKADITPAVQVDHDHKTDPVVIYSQKTGQEKLNYPRTFYANGVAKNQATNGLYKPTVRMFKNWAINHINDDSVISSFKIQALVYNVPDKDFFDNYPANFIVAGYDMLEMLKSNGFAPKPIMSVCGGEDINIGWDPTLRAFFISRLSDSLTHAANAYNAAHQTVAELSWRKAFNLG